MSQADIKERLLNDLYKRGVITANNSSSVVDQIMTAVSVQIARVEEESRNNLNNSRLSTARGKALDEWGVFLQLPRINPLRAKSNHVEQNVKFITRNSNTFFNIFGSSIPSLVGTRIYDRTRTKEYVVTGVDPVTSDGSYNYIYVTVEASGVGAVYNLGESDLASHTISDARIQVVNNFPIINGRDEERDEEYLARLLVRYRSYKGSNESYINNIINKYTEIGKFKIIHNNRGICNTRLVLQPILGYTLSDNLIESIAREIRSKIPAGHSVNATLPDLVPIIIETNIYTFTPLTASEKEILLNNVRNAIVRFFNQFPIGKNLSYSELATAVKNSDPRIKSIGNNEGKFNLCTYTISEYGVIETYPLERNYICKDHELVTFNSDSSTIRVI
jgi:uncharacterized phage protein gp47/JayE